LGLLELGVLLLEELLAVVDVADGFVGELQIGRRGGDDAGNLGCLDLRRLVLRLGWDVLGDRWRWGSGLLILDGRRRWR